METALQGVQRTPRAIVSSILATRTFPCHRCSARGLIVALHGEGADVDQFAALADEVTAQYHLLLAEGPHPLTPYTISSPQHFAGYGWYAGEGNVVNDIARFGHALCSLEDLLAQCRKAVPDQPVLLVGFKQGAVMALTLAQVAPGLLDGVVSICGSLLASCSWRPPLQPLNCLPIAFVHDSHDSHASETELRRSIEALSQQGAKVVSSSVTGCVTDPAAVGALIGRFMDDLVENVGERNWIQNR